MKKITWFYIFLTIFTISCKEKSQNEKSKKVNQTAQVKHYICLNNCENSGSDTQGICPTCKTAYAHNDAFHANDFLKSGPLTVPNSTSTQNNTQNTSPAQNRYGFYHYTCSKGCTGGSGVQENCKTCGNPLEHNQAYHNQ